MDLTRWVYPAIVVLTAGVLVAAWLVLPRGDDSSTRSADVIREALDDTVAPVAPVAPLPPMVMLTAEQVRTILDDNDPPDWPRFELDSVRQGNINLLSDVCRGIGTIPLDTVKATLAIWFAQRLVEMNATDPGFDVGGIVDQLAALGCPNP